MDVSPNYLMKLIEQIDQSIWTQHKSYKNAEFYIKKWQIFNDGSPNFWIQYAADDKIDLIATLHTINNESLLKIAADLGIETLGFIPSIPIIKNILKTDYHTAFESFNKAIKQIEINPDLAVGLANSTLESILKHLLQNNLVRVEWNKKDTLYDLTTAILKEFQLFPDSTMPIELKQIGSSLLNVSKQIENLRSEKTTMHGKLAKDYVIEEPLYALFIINVVASVGLFLINFYDKKYKLSFHEISEIEVSPEDIPF